MFCNDQPDRYNDRRYFSIFKIRIRKWKDRDHNGQNKKVKMTTNNLQNIIFKTKDRLTQTQ